MGSVFFLDHGKSGVSQWSYTVQGAEGWDQSGLKGSHDSSVAMLCSAKLRSFALFIWAFPGSVEEGEWMKGRTREIPSVAAEDKQQNNGD